MFSVEAYNPAAKLKFQYSFEEFKSTIEKSGLPEFFSLDDAIGMTRKRVKGKKIANVLAFSIFNRNDKK